MAHNQLKATGTVRFGCGLGIVLVVAIILALLTVGPYTDYLWFKEDAGYTRVFSLQYTVRATLFAVGVFGAWGALYLGWRQALAFKFVYVEVPEGPVRQITNAIMLVNRYGSEALRFIAPICGLIAGLALSNEWQTLLFAQHSHAFGRKDPIFGLDYSFFVFEVPWLGVMINCVTAIITLIAVLHVVTAGGLRLIQKFAPIESNIAQVTARACGWVGVALIGFGISTAFSCLEYGSKPGAQFVGAGYSEVIRLQMTGLFAGAVVLLGVIVLISRSLTVAWKAAIPCAAVFFLLVVAVPAVVQSVKVEPDKNHVEAPFAQRAISATRFAYDIANIDVKEMPTHDEPTEAEITTAKGTFDNMRLWDPAVLQEAIEQLQTFKPYYAFNDVDIDRYTLPDEHGNLRQQMMMVSPRDISTLGLVGSSQNWVNTKLVYTHGYGVVAAAVNTSNDLGQPDMIVKDLPVTGPSQLAQPRPQMYFSDYKETDSYAIVNTKVDEFDYPTQTGEANHRWTGTSGIHIDSFTTRVAFSIALADWTLLVNQNLTNGSRLQLHRGVIDRASKLYPFLSFDKDPYVVVLKDRIVWVLDGYTTTDRIPYSDMSVFGDRPANYVRNSVKIVVDAYTGQMTAYGVRPDDPILQAYQDIYPGLVHPLAEVPAEIRAHFRYPEDLFAVQSDVLCTYHVTDPQQFLSNADAWSIPNERGLSGAAKEPSRPYFIQMRLPDGSTDEFVLMRGFTPYTRDNLSGWIAAHCDGDLYGKLSLYLFAKGATVPGPWQVENLFVQDSRVADVNRQFNNDQSKIQVGNMLVVPVGSSIVYAESLFLRGNSARGIPELRRVVLATKDRIEMGVDYKDALAKLFGTRAAPAPIANSTGQTKPTTAVTLPSTVNRGEVEKIEKLLDSADVALRKGDFAKYGELQGKARKALHDLTAGQPAK